MPLLRFNLEIYRKEAVREAISAYSHLAHFKDRSNKNYMEVKIERIEPKFKNILADEFKNYTLGITKKCI